MIFEHIPKAWGAADWFPPTLAVISCLIMALMVLAFFSTFLILQDPANAGRCAAIVEGGNIAFSRVSRAAHISMYTQTGIVKHDGLRFRVYSKYRSSLKVREFFGGRYLIDIYSNDEGKWISVSHVAVVSIIASRILHENPDVVKLSNAFFDLCKKEALASLTPATDMS